jgi:hypothetical protein
LSDGTFFQAPLFLYPVRLEKNNVNARRSCRFNFIGECGNGNVPQGGSSLVKDYEELIVLSEESDLSLVGELIEPQDVEFEAEGDQLETEKEDHLKDSDILNLLQAEGSQQEIIKEASYKKGLVVHGPPGTVNLK